MGLLSFLFSSGADKPGSDEPGANASYAELMTSGKRLLFAAKMKPATRVFTRAATASPEDPLPLAYRSWAERLHDKKRATSDAQKAVDLDPNCAEAYMSLALAHTTGAVDFEQAATALSVGRKLLPRDADGSVLFIGVNFIFVDVFASMQEDENGLQYDFKATPLRNAADWLLSGEHAAALRTFEKIHQTGTNLAGAIGVIATYWAMHDQEAALMFAKILTDSGAINDIRDPGMLTAIRTIHDASKKKS